MSIAQTPDDQPLEPACCNLCGSSESRVVFEDPPPSSPGVELADFLASVDRFDHYGRIVRCRGCGLVYTSPRPSSAALAHGYTVAVDNDYAQEDASRSINAHLALNTIKRFAQRGKLLDVGCATGYFLNAARLYFETCGVEPSRWAADYARERLRLEVHQGVLEEVSLAPASFDVVTLNDVIEHLVDPAAALARLGALLRPGGLIYLVTPNIESVSARLLRGYWWGLRPAHLYYFSPATLTAMLEKNGFQVVWLKRYGRMFTYKYWLSRLKSYPRWLSATAGAIIRGLGIEDKFLYLDTRDSMEVCAVKRD
jgi:2-polyprenyl-3-methyl-5-hydroxy-6-metoxy-1,4-benzoquinol methylase